MANVLSVLNEQIKRLARREAKALVRVARRLTAQHRRDIAALKRLVSRLSKSVGFLEKQEEKRVGRRVSVAPDEIKGVRFSSRSVRAQRRRLSLSAKDYGQLVGVSGLTVYQWESGKSRPRKKQLAGLVSVRGIGKREALKRLELLSK